MAAETHSIIYWLIVLIVIIVLVVVLLKVLGYILGIAPIFEIENEIVNNSLLVGSPSDKVVSN